MGELDRNMHKVNDPGCPLKGKCMFRLVNLEVTQMLVLRGNVYFFLNQINDQSEPQI